MDWVIENARLIDPASGTDRTGDIAVVQGQIAAVGEGLAAAARREGRGAEVLSGEGWIVAPGLVDLHAHCGEPGGVERETLASLAQAAAAGGFSTVLVMPDTPQPIDSPAGVAYVRAVGARGTEAGPAARLLPACCLSKGRQGAELAEIGEAALAGAVAVTDASPVANAALVRRGLEYAAMFDLPVLLAPGDPHLSGDGVMHEGPVATILGLKGIPAAAEEVGVTRELILAGATGARMHLQHVTTARSLERICEARARGVRVTCEVTFHHLFLTDTAVRGYDTNAKLNPPLRPAEDVAALVAGVADGTVDCIVTDHTPRAREEKEVEFDWAAWGAIGLEMALGAVATYLIEPGRLTWLQALAALSARPARLLGLPGGSLRPGAPADLVVIDPVAEWTVAPERLASLSRNTPLAGRTLRGQAVATAVGGRWVYATSAAARRWTALAAEAAGSAVGVGPAGGPSGSSPAPIGGSRR